MRDAKQVFNELRCALGPTGSSHARTPRHPFDAITLINRDPTRLTRPRLFPLNSAGTTVATPQRTDQERARFFAVQRRKLQRFEDLIDDLGDLTADGDPSTTEREERESAIESMRVEAKRLADGINAAAAAAATPPTPPPGEKEGDTSKEGDAASKEGDGSMDEDAGAFASLGRMADAAKASVAGAVAGAAAGELGTALKDTLKVSTSEVGDKLKDGLGAVGLGRREGEETSSTKGLSSRELLDVQRAQMNAQDETLEKLIPLTEKLNDTAELICDEVDLQSRMVEDLERDFRHTQDRQKKLRKQGFKLSGQKNEEEKERAEREEAMEELRKQVTLQQVQHSYEKEEEEEDSGCVVM
jgi:hypothetical protein